MTIEFASTILAQQDAEFGEDASAWTQSALDSGANLSGLYTGSTDGLTSASDWLANQDADFSEPDTGGDFDLQALLDKQQEEDAGLLKTNTAAAKTGTDTKTLDSLLKKVEDPKVLSALITAGMGMLSGASKGKMQEKAWKREENIRQQEIARKNANARPGAVGKMTWSPANASGTGLLGAKVG